MSNYEYRDPDGDCISLLPLVRTGGTRAVSLMAVQYGSDHPPTEAVVHIPLEHVEEVVAGLRDMARQAGGKASALPGAPITAEPLTEAELERATDELETAIQHSRDRHEYCSIDCEAKFPSAMLRNGVLAGSYPGAGGMLDELLRRAATAPR